MRFKFLPFAAAAVAAIGAGVCAQSAAAKDLEFQKSLKAGATAELLQHSSMRGNCDSKVPKIKILDQPGNGSATIKEVERKFRGGKGDFAKCDGKTGVGGAVVYKPKDGFVGSDKLRYEVTFDSGRVSVYAFTIRIGSGESGGWVKAK